MRARKAAPAPARSAGVQRCWTCQRPVRADQHACSHCGAIEPATHPLIRKFIGANLHHTTMEDFDHDHATLTGHGKQQTLGKPSLLVAALAAAVGFLGANPTYLEIAKCAGVAGVLAAVLGFLTSSRKRFTVKFDGKKTSWSSNDDHYWAEAKKLFLDPGFEPSPDWRPPRLGWIQSELSIANALPIAAAVGVALVGQPFHTVANARGKKGVATEIVTRDANLDNPGSVRAPQPSASPQVVRIEIGDGKAAPARPGDHPVDLFPQATPSPGGPDPAAQALARLGELKTGGPDGASARPAVPLPPSPTGAGASAAGGPNAHEQQKVQIVLRGGGHGGDAIRGGEGPIQRVDFLGRTPPGLARLDPELRLEGVIDLAEYVAGDPGTRTFMKGQVRGKPGPIYRQWSTRLLPNGEIRTLDRDGKGSGYVFHSRKFLRILYPQLAILPVPRIAAYGKRAAIPDQARLLEANLALDTPWAALWPCAELGSEGSFRTEKLLFCRGHGLMRIQITDANGKLEEEWLPAAKLAIHWEDLTEHLELPLPPAREAELARLCNEGSDRDCQRLGTSLEVQGRIGEAKLAYARACDGSYGLACLDLSYLLHRQGKLADAEAVARQACERGYREGCRRAGALALDPRKDLATARRELRFACEHQDELGCSLLGLLEQEQGETQTAIEAFRSSCGKGILNDCYQVPGFPPAPRI